MTAGLGAALDIPMRMGLAVSPLRFVWISAFVVAALLFDLRLHREALFLANLGVSRLQLVGLGVGACAALELLLWVSLRG